MKQIDIIFVVVVVFIIIRTWVGLETELSSYKLCCSSEGPGLDSQPRLLFHTTVTPLPKDPVSSSDLWAPSIPVAHRYLCLYVCMQGTPTHKIIF